MFSIFLLFFIFLFIWALIFIFKYVYHRMTNEQRNQKKRLLQFLYFIIYFIIMLYLKELRHIIITWAFSWLGFTLFSKSPFIWSVGSEESSSSSTIRAPASPPRERDIDDVFSLGGKHDAQASSSHLAHEQTDARLPAAGEPAPSDSQPAPTHSTEPEAAPPSPRVSPYPYAFDQVI